MLTGKSDCPYKLGIILADSVYQITQSDLRHNHTNELNRELITRIPADLPIVTALNSLPFSGFQKERDASSRVKQVLSVSDEDQSDQNEDEDDSSTAEDPDNEEDETELTDSSDEDQSDLVSDVDEVSVIKYGSKKAEGKVVAVQASLVSVGPLRFKYFNTLKDEFKRLCAVCLSSPLSSATRYSEANAWGNSSLLLWTE